MLKRLGISTTILALIVTLIASSMPIPTAAQTPDDYPVSGGWFYSQTNGYGGGGNIGFTVTNANGIPMWDTFQSYGGVSALGYPISNRFLFKGQVTQVFQKGALQWQPSLGTLLPVNIFDELSAAGFDDWLLTTKSIPKALDWSGDAGLPFSQVIARHQAILDPYPPIRDAYFSLSDPITLSGLPMGVQDFGNLVAVRGQRQGFQLWRVNTPFAAAGTVTIINGGEIAAEAGLWPSAALAPQPPGAGQQPVAPTPPAPTPTPTPVPPTAVCNGDERMFFSPPNPVVGQQVFVNVTSARPSANVNLTGAWGPRFNSVGPSGGLTVWTWTFTPQSPGRYDYNFTINGVVCTANFVNVGGSTPPPPPQPTPTPIPPQPGDVCGGESYSTNPGRVVANQPFTLQVSAPKAARPISLMGPGSPGNPNLEPRPGLWSFNIGPLPAGVHEYTWTVRGQTCFRFAVVVNSQ